MLLHNAEGNAVALVDERLVLFVRVLPLTTEAMVVAETELWKRLEQATVERPAALWIVVAGDAGLSAPALLDHQRAVFARMVSEAGRLFVASSIIGSSVQSMAIRAVGNGFAKKRAHIQLFSDTRSAAQWLSAATKIPRERLQREAEAYWAACEQQSKRDAVSF